MALTHHQLVTAINAGWSVYIDGVPVTDVKKLPSRAQMAAEANDPAEAQAALTELQAQLAEIKAQISLVQFNQDQARMAAGDGGGATAPDGGAVVASSGGGAETVKNDGGGAEPQQ